MFYRRVRCAILFSFSNRFVFHPKEPFMSTDSKLFPGLSQRPDLIDLSALLLDWYDRNARTLPWRDDPSPYHVLLSEVMLQQTQVETVIPYFRRFIAELPDFAALSVVEDARLLRLWQGLGYYRRAHYLKRAAIEIMRLYGGVLPADYHAIRRLPGVGDYTAGAVASIAFGLPVAAVDGNVLRVLARITGSKADVTAARAKKDCAALVTELMDTRRPGDFTQALMELGAVICRPGAQAKCACCPVNRLCLARAQNNVAALPVKAPTKPRRQEHRSLLLIRQKDALLLRRREDGGLLGGLYEPVNLPGHLTEAEIKAFVTARGGRLLALDSLGERRHLFTHISWHMRGWLVDTQGLCDFDDHFFAPLSEIADGYPMPSAFKGFINQVL
jgi:A/G-specific adenine glycosylase